VIKNLLLLVLLSSLTLSCSESSTKSEHTDSNKDTLENPSSDGTEEYRMITLPTPMQIPALLRNTRTNYSKSVMFPIIKEEKSYFTSSVLMGMYLMDLAYASVNNDHQTARIYFDECRRLGSDIGLGIKLNERLVERFDENIERPDSLGIIILEMYDMGHAYFIEQGKDGLGLLLVMGWYGEGMNLVFKKARGNDLLLFLHLIQQQRQYAENLVYGLNQFEIPEELEDEYAIIVKINDTFNSMSIPTIYQLRTGQRNVSEIDQDKLRELEALVEEFRNSISV